MSRRTQRLRRRRAKTRHRSPTVAAVATTTTTTGVGPTKRRAMTIKRVADRVVQVAIWALLLWLYFKYFGLFPDPDDTYNPAL